MCSWEKVRVFVKVSAPLSCLALPHAAPVPQSAGPCYSLLKGKVIPKDSSLSSQQCKTEQLNIPPGPANADEWTEGSE